MSVMLRCGCGFELTIPDEAATGLVSCPACHQDVDPTVAVIHPRIDDLDPELLLISEDDEPATAAPATPPAPAMPSAQSSRTAKSSDEFDDLSMLIDLPDAPNEDSDLAFLMSDELTEQVPNKSQTEELLTAEPTEVSTASDLDLEGAIAAPLLDDASLLGLPTPTIMPPPDDDEGYAIVEEDYSQPSKSASWLEDAGEDIDSNAIRAAEAAGAARRGVPDDDDDIMIAEDAPEAKPLRPAAQVQPIGPRDALDELLDDDLNLFDESIAVVPAAITACPSCNHPLDAGAVLCVNCGYNLRLGKKIDGSATGGGDAAKLGTTLPHDTTLTGGDDADKSSLVSKLTWSDPRITIATAGVGIAVVLGLVGFILFGGGGGKPSTSGGTATGTPGTVSTATGATPGGGTSPGDQSPVRPTVTRADTSHPQLRLVPQGITGKAVSIDLVDDNQLLAVGLESGTAILYDLERGETKQTFVTGHQGAVNVDLDPAAGRLITGFTGGVKLWNAADGKEVRSFKAPVDGAWQTRFINQGNAFFASGPAGPFSIVDLTAGGRTRSVKLNMPTEPQPVMDVTPDGTIGIIGRANGVLEVMDVATGRPSGELLGHTTKIAAVTISPDGSQVLSAAGGAEYRLVGKELWLASNRPTDFCVRLWDIATRQELLRLPLPADKPCTCLAFSPNGKLAAVVAGDVRIIDLANHKLLAIIAPAASAIGYTAQGSSGPALPTEPFRLARFFRDGMRLVTTGQTSGVHIWELPSEPKPQDLPGIMEPANLASFKPALDAEVAPLELPAVTPSTDADANNDTSAVDNNDAASALTARQAVSAKATEVSAAKDENIAAFRQELAAEPTTVDRLWQLAEISYKKKLLLEAEECLRGLLLAQPNHSKAQKVYQQLGKSQPENVGPITPARAWAQTLNNLDDAGQRPEPPRNKRYVSIPIDVALVGKGTKIDANTVTGKAGDNPADFLGIYRRSTGEVQGAKKGTTTTTAPAQVWEAMAVTTGRNGNTVVLLLNRRKPQVEQPRGNQPAGGSGAPKIKMVTDGIRVREDYAGPYEAIFMVPQDESLTEIQWEDTLPVYLLGEESRSLDDIAADADATTAERLAAIKALGAMPTSTADATLDEVIASGDDKLFDAARAALRQVRRQANLIAPEFLPVSKPEDARLYAIAHGKMDPTGLTAAIAGYGGGSGTAGAGITPLTQYSYCKMVWKIPQPGKYRVRLASFGDSPDFPIQQALEFTFTAEDANWYVVTAKIDREVEFDAQLVELWKGLTLQERRFLAHNPWDISALAARLKLAGVDAPAAQANAGSGRAAAGAGFAPGGLNAGSGNIEQKSPKLDPFANAMNVSTDTRPLFGKPASQLPTVERAVLEELLYSLPESRRSVVPGVVVDVIRLDTPVEPARAAALARLKQALAEDAPAVFARVAQVGHGPAALAAIDSLRQLGGESALACRTLIDLQNGPADIKQAAEQAVGDLMTQGVIAQRGANWLYHGKTHFPEPDTDGDNAETSGAPTKL